MIDIWGLMLVRATVSTFLGIVMHVAFEVVWAIFVGALLLPSAGFWTLVIIFHLVGWLIAFRTITAEQI